MAEEKITSAKSTDELLNDLKNPDWKMRARAVYCLKNRMSKKVRAKLLNLLDDKHDNVWLSVVNVLRNTQNQELIDSLVEKLKNSKSAEIRWHAAYYLGEIGNKNVTDYLCNALNDESTEVRFNAAKALGKIGDKKTVDSLLKALDDKESISSINLISPKKPVSTLVRHLKDEDERVRSLAAILIGKTKTKDAFDELIGTLNDDNNIVRVSAIYALDKLGGDQIVEPLVNALKDPYWEVRSDAAKSLGNVHDDQAVVPLLETLNDENTYVRRSALKALENYKIFKK